MTGLGREERAWLCGGRKSLRVAVARKPRLDPNPIVFVPSRSFWQGRFCRSWVRCSNECAVALRPAIYDWDSHCWGRTSPHNPLTLNWMGTLFHVCTPRRLGMTFGRS